MSTNSTVSKTISCFIAKALILTFMLSLIGCARTMYGVPEKEWEKLTDEQRLSAINGYNEREKLREQARAAEVERRAKERAEKAVEQQRQQEIAQRRIEAIYAGETGDLGDLIRVSIQGGDMLFGKKRRPYQPVALKIASGESRAVEVVSNDRNYNDSVILNLSYREGLLLIDETDFRPDLAARLVYDSLWKRGNSYTISSRGSRELNSVRVNVEVIPHLRRH